MAGQLRLHLGGLVHTMVCAASRAFSGGGLTTKRLPADTHMFCLLQCWQGLMKPGMMGTCRVSA
jgi:hypothetical protein